MEQKTNLKRLAGEKKLLEKQIPSCKIIQESQSANNNPLWIIQIQGPEDSPFKGYCFNLSFEFQNYPFEFPNIKVTTPIFHPDIDNTNGEFCQQMLNSDQWVPTKKLYDILLTIITILQQPSGENSLNKEATELFKTDVQQYKKKAQEYTEKHAIKQQ